MILFLFAVLLIGCAQQKPEYKLTPPSWAQGNWQDDGGDLLQITRDDVISTLTTDADLVRMQMADPGTIDIAEDCATSGITEEYTTIKGQPAYSVKISDLHIEYTFIFSDANTMKYQFFIWEGQGSETFESTIIKQ